MPDRWTQETEHDGATALHPRVPHLIVLQDHARLPWRFFGRLTAGLHAGL
jgi:hypothetical protein